MAILHDRRADAIAASVNMPLADRLVFLFNAGVMALAYAIKDDEGRQRLNQEIIEIGNADPKSVTISADSVRQ